MIDEVVILNLPRCTDRKDHCIRKLLESGTPPNKIRVWEAKDDLDYEKTREVYEAAITDGFSHFKKLLNEGKHNSCAIALAAQTWNYLQVFREYSQSNKTIVFLHDDWHFKESYDFGDIEDLIRYGMDLDDNLKYISLQYGKDAEGIAGNIPSEKLILPEKLLARGFVGHCHDVAMVLTPSGAEAIMNLWTAKLPHKTLEVFFMSLIATPMLNCYTSVQHLVIGSGFPSTIYKDECPIRDMNATRD